MKKEIISAILALTVVGGTFAIGAKVQPSTVVAQDSISELEQRQAELKQKSEQYQKELEKNNSKIAKTKQYQKTLLNRIDAVNDEIVVSQEKITTLNNQISAKTKKIKKLNSDISSRTNTLRKRIKTIYMSGDVSSLEIILGAKDFSDFLDKVELVRNVSNFDEKLISDIETDMKTVKSEKAALVKDKAKQVKEKKNLQAKQADLQSVVDENSKVLSTLYTRNKKQEAAIKANNGALNGIDDQIQSYYEEQAKKAAEKARQNSSNNGSNNSSNSGSNNSSNNNGSSNNSGGSSSGGSSNSGGGSYTPVTPSGSGYTWPVPGHTALSSVFGEDRGSYGHGAIDISDGSIMGATVVAADSGTVVVSNNSCTHNWGKSGSCGCGGGYGNYVWIDHGNGKCTIYGHLTRAVVSQGSHVSKGQVIGYVGSTGWSSGPHLHFECRINGTKYDPMSEF
ncbi:MULTISPECIES: murein hydrolase activator EnvC family protein [Ruminococcus]|uniref:Uncharacterized protein n=1 Tax=Ruminococcus bovis TaxID=2564099 RepID=A0A4P8XU38_9FIRM|nr:MULTISPECIES: M23 family metallopeptidase [Ruminococcus]MEE3439374.1 peptidoglycan DD-metalloendopeptidase family protein [Ruminococcus sp.]QCT06521.1 hypothetical protein E5Z56_03725 [Ruminococcus bovis]